MSFFVSEKRGLSELKKRNPINEKIRLFLREGEKFFNSKRKKWGVKKAKGKITKKVKKKRKREKKKKKKREEEKKRNGNQVVLLP